MSGPPITPFPGLRPFQADEDYLFFGREEQIAELVAVLRKNRFVAVVGTSGSGKSSLVRAGLLPALHGGTMVQAGSHWQEVVMRPGGSPLLNLARALLDAGLYDSADPESLLRIRATLSRSRFGLVEALRQSDSNATKTLIVVDQFEELFRFRVQEEAGREDAAALVKLLLTASESPEVSVFVVITMRSDYLGECAQIPGLAEAVNHGEYLIPQLKRHQRRDAIEKPALVAGGRIAPRLVQQLLNDVGDDQDQLPVLQHALMRMWDHWKTKHPPPPAHSPDSRPPLDLEDYEEIGGLNEALSRHADEVYDALPDERHRQAASRIFMALTERGPDNRGIRRPTRFDRLCAIVGSEEGVVRRVVEEFRAPGRTFLMPPAEAPIEANVIIDISHESLMRIWGRLRNWVEEEAQAARIYHRLAETARLYEEGKAGLYHDPDLQIALTWWEKWQPSEPWGQRYDENFQQASSFLEASRSEAFRQEREHEAARQKELEQARMLAEARQLRLEHEQRSGRKLRVVIAGLAVLAILAGVACLVAVMAHNRADRLTRRVSETLNEVERQKTQVEDSLKKTQTSEMAARHAEQEARDAEEAGRQLLYATDIQLAPFVWGDSHSGAEQLHNLLDKHIPAPGKPDLRSFEWYYQKYLMKGTAKVLSGHATPVLDAALLRDGRVVTIDQKAQLKHWEWQTESELASRDLGTLSNAQRKVLSPDGQLVALALRNKILLLSAETGQELFQLNSSNVNQRRLIFSPDSRMLVCVTKGVQWWNCTNGQEIASLDARLESCKSVSLTADGLTLVVGGYGPSTEKFSTYRLDPTTRTIRRGRDFDGHSTLRALTISPDGSLIATGQELDGTLSIYATSNRREIASHASAHPTPISALAFSPDGTRLATAGSDGTIKVWTDARHLTSTNEPDRTFKGHTRAVTKLFFSGDGELLVSCSQDNDAKIWQLNQRVTAVHPLSMSDVGTVGRFSPDGLLIAAREGGRVALWDGATGRLVQRLLDRDDRRTYGMAFSPDNRLLALGFGETKSEVALVDIDTHRQIATFPALAEVPALQQKELPSKSPIGALAFSPNGKYLVGGFGTPFTLLSTPNFAPLFVWDVSTRRLFRRLSGHLGFCSALQFSPDGTVMASASYDGSIRLWSTATWETVRTLQNVITNSERERIYMDASFSPDGRTLAVASYDQTASLWDVATGKLLTTLKGHSGAVTAVAFSPDGRTLATGGADQIVLLWNVATRRELMRLDCRNVIGYVTTLAFSPDGKQLLGGGESGFGLWSAASPLWNRPDLAAEKLGALLNSPAAFKSRVRLFSENKRLHESLSPLERPGTEDRRLQAALAATRANWHASQKRWPQAVQEFDRLLGLNPTDPGGWLRTPGLLRLARALLEQKRPADAAALLTGGAQRRKEDGLSDMGILGFKYQVTADAVRVTDLIPGSPAERRGVRPGDVLLKVGDLEMNESTFSKFPSLISVSMGDTVRVRVRHQATGQIQDLELRRERFLVDKESSELLESLRERVSQFIAQRPEQPELFELRADLVGLLDMNEQMVADYTTALKLMAERATSEVNKSPAASNPAPSGSELGSDWQRIYLGRGDAYLALKKWQLALDDYARVVTDKTTDEKLLRNQAQATAELLLEVRDLKWKALKPMTAESAGGTTLTVLDDDSVLASGKNPEEDSYTITCVPGMNRITAIRLEVLTDPSLPGDGPGRYPKNGNFHLHEFRVSAGGVPQVLANILVSYAENEQYKQIIDGEIDTSLWGVDGKEGRNHDAVFKSDIKLNSQDPLKFELIFSKYKTLHGLGHFRLSVHDAPDAFDYELKRLNARESRDPWKKLATAHQLRGDQQALERLLDRRPQLATTVGDLYAAETNWTTAVMMYSKGTSMQVKDSELFGHRARAYEELRDWKAAAADWDQAAPDPLHRARFHAEFANRLVPIGEPDLAAQQRLAARQRYEQVLADDPGNGMIAEELPPILFQMAQNAAHWTVLEPVQMKSDAGTTFTQEKDGFIRTVDEAGTSTNYMITFQATPASIGALRIELENADPSLVANPTNTRRAGPAIDHQILFPQRMERSNPSLRGRLIRVSKINNEQVVTDEDLVLSLAEVEVFQGTTNHALNRRARQSSTSTDGSASKAIDGKTEGSRNAVTRTGYDPAPWWQVDLGEEKEIDRIVIWNRTDARTRQRLNNSQVIVYDRSAKPAFIQFIAEAPASSREIASWATLDSSVTPPGQTRLTLRLHADAWPKGAHRFRIAATEDLTAFQHEIKRNAAWTQTNAWRKLAAAYVLEGNSAKAAECFANSFDRSGEPLVKSNILQHAAQYADVLDRLLAPRLDESALRRDWLQFLIERSDFLFDIEALARAEKSLELILPTSEEEAQNWQMTTAAPPRQWTQPSFDDSSWVTARGAFGTRATLPNRTDWPTPEIWLRRQFNLTFDPKEKHFLLRIHHDDDAEIYLNGTLVATASRWTRDYIFHPLDSSVRSLLVKGSNLLAVQCRNKEGAAVIDVGIIATSESFSPVESASN